MDDLLDLNWSSPTSSLTSTSTAPSQPSQPSLKPLQKSSFDILSRPSASHSPNYVPSPIFTSRAPSPLPSALPSKSINKPNALTPSPLASNTASPNPATGDAFSGLLGLPDTATGVEKNLSLAERQRVAAEEKERKDKLERAQFDHTAFWDKLGQSSTTSHSSKPNNIIHEGLNGLKILQPTSKTPSVISKTPSPTPQTVQIISTPQGLLDDEDDFGLLAVPKPSKPQNASPKMNSVAADPWDFDQLSSTISSGPSRTHTPLPNFESGEDEDDLLGDLVKPVVKVTKPVSPFSQSCSQALTDDYQKSSTLSPSTSSPRKQGDRGSSSPPPHIVGQIVEMGFSPLQARQALAQTSTGLDVQAALEILLAVQTEEEVPSFDDEDIVLRERVRREEEERERRRRRRQGPSRDTVLPRTPEERKAETGSEYDTDKILAQASAIGQDVLSKATSFWNSSKEKALKVYEEQRKAMEANTSKERKAKGAEGRPKWMAEAEDYEQHTRSPEKPSRVDREDSLRRRRTSDDMLRSNGQSSSSREGKAEEERYLSVKERTDLLFSDDLKPYRSPVRHGKSTRDLSETQKTTVRPKTPIPSSASASASRSSQLPSRSIVPATPSQIQQSAAKKTQGNEHFKLGRFAEAEAAYTSAISFLPEGHLSLISLYNNRAATRLKLGESTSAVSDSTIVIDLIGTGYHPNKEAPLPLEAADVRLGEALVKATMKRAQAWEIGEKWKSALEDWERVFSFDTILMGSSPASIRTLALEGARRCRKMLEPSPPTQTNGETSVKAKGPSVAKVSKEKGEGADVNKSKAVDSLRKVAAAQEAEEEERLRLKDTIDARLQAWRGGKENNLRALIASLDVVLWDEVLSGGLKVGMHELISEKQVKIKYMKVIARLHPDKLDAGKTTLEQRMLANGAFGTLNEASVITFHVLLS
ncbi:hypothetical protein M231_03142 [Tremella mesenterica]|uniref:UBA domain-containing protein n=1 Tax=Tremella mesenterica TaxID=5217 RepID=A0A4Q1BPB3_TREME|nr:hypothetical protein M231_03142 [Tremella mesenterica]